MWEEPNLTKQYCVMTKEYRYKGCSLEKIKTIITQKL